MVTLLLVKDLVILSHYQVMRMTSRGGNPSPNFFTTPLGGRLSLDIPNEQLHLGLHSLVQNTATDFAQLKAALSKAFPAIRNKKDLEVKFYASQQRRYQEPTDFAYDLLELNKKLELEMSEEALVDHIFVRLEPQVQDDVEVRNPQNTVQLLEVFSKSLRKDIRAKQSEVRGIVIMLEDEVGMSVGCLMLMIGEVGEIRKFCVNRVTAEMVQQQE
ncbi:uncharacterized protein TNCV_4630221 [Trichonephila clavipes]|nr:uncharacterized protein TNCV_4630221 [Trichonephila clavipes]